MASFANVPDLNLSEIVQYFYEAEQDLLPRIFMWADAKLPARHSNWRTEGASAVSMVPYSKCLMYYERI